MNKTTLQITAILLIVAGCYYYLFKDSFRKPNIQIIHTIRPKATALRGPSATDAVVPHAITFGMDREYKLTEVKVVPVSDLETNKYAHAVWDLVSKTNSHPTRGFTYGTNIRGMRPAVDGAKPEPLEPNVTYRLFVQAGSLKGEHDFKVSEDDHVTE
ncbi:MAG TPA: hypothetical protein VH598_10745 [Verrucomicrobiae bacterium]|nr:hypothetical protein [Verrucomicrobiae bacterium]